MPSFRATLFYLIISYKQGLQSSIYQKTKKTAIYIKLTSIDAEIGASKKKSHNLEYQQENKHEQSEYLFSPDVTTTKSRSAKHGNGKAVGFWSDK